jgi:hypothetical protein
MLKLSNLDWVRRYYRATSDQSDKSDLNDQQQQTDPFQTAAWLVLLFAARLSFRSDSCELTG